MVRERGVGGIKRGRTRESEEGETEGTGYNGCWGRGVGGRFSMAFVVTFFSLGNACTRML